MSHGPHLPSVPPSFRQRMTKFLKHPATHVGLTFPVAAMALAGSQDKLRPKEVVSGFTEPFREMAEHPNVTLPSLLTLGALGGTYYGAKRWAPHSLEPGGRLRGIKVARNIFVNRVAPVLTGFALGVGGIKGWQAYQQLKNARSEEDIAQGNRTLGNSFFNTSVAATTWGEFGMHAIPRANQLVPRIFNPRPFPPHTHSHGKIVTYVPYLHEPIHLLPLLNLGNKDGHDHDHGHDHEAKPSSPPNTPTPSPSNKPQAPTNPTPSPPAHKDHDGHHHE